jgi:inorganic pyrophosphatase
MNPYAKLQPFDRESGALNVVIDTPKGSRNKYAWDEKLKLFSLTGVLPAGDRLIAVSVNSRTHEKLKSITDLDATLLDEIEHFFVSYNEVKGKKVGRRFAIVAPCGSYFA